MHCLPGARLPLAARWAAGPCFRRRAHVRFVHFGGSEGRAGRDTVRNTVKAPEDVTGVPAARQTPETEPATDATAGASEVRSTPKSGEGTLRRKTKANEALEKPEREPAAKGTGGLSQPTRESKASDAATAASEVRNTTLRRKTKANEALEKPEREPAAEGAAAAGGPSPPMRESKASDDATGVPAAWTAAAAGGPSPPTRGPQAPEGATGDSAPDPERSKANEAWLAAANRELNAHFDPKLPAPKLSVHEALKAYAAAYEAARRAPFRLQRQLLQRLLNALLAKRATVEARDGMTRSRPFSSGLALTANSLIQFAATVGCDIDALACRSALLLTRRHKAAHLSYDILRIAEQAGCASDPLLYETVLAHAVAHGSTLGAHRLVLRAAARGVPPTAVMFSLLLFDCSSWRNEAAAAAWWGCAAALLPGGDAWDKGPFLARDSPFVHLIDSQGTYAAMERLVAERYGSVAASTKHCVQVLLDRSASHVARAEALFALLPSPTARSCAALLRATGYCRQLGALRERYAAFAQVSGHRNVRWAYLEGLSFCALGAFGDVAGWTGDLSGLPDAEGVMQAADTLAEGWVAMFGERRGRENSPWHLTCAYALACAVRAARVGGVRGEDFPREPAQGNLAVVGDASWDSPDESQGERGVNSGAAVFPWGELDKTLGSTPSQHRAAVLTAYTAAATAVEAAERRCGRSPAVGGPGADGGTGHSSGFGQKWRRELAAAAGPAERESSHQLHACWMQGWLRLPLAHEPWKTTGAAARKVAEQLLSGQLAAKDGTISRENPRSAHSGGPQKMRANALSESVGGPGGSPAPQSRRAAAGVDGFVARPNQGEEDDTLFDLSPPGAFSADVTTDAPPLGPWVSPASSAGFPAPPPPPPDDTLFDISPPGAVSTDVTTDAPLRVSPASSARFPAPPPPELAAGWPAFALSALPTGKSLEAGHEVEEVRPLRVGGDEDGRRSKPRATFEPSSHRHGKPLVLSQEVGEPQPLRVGGDPDGRASKIRATADACVRAVKAARLTPHAWQRSRALAQAYTKGLHGLSRFAVGPPAPEGGACPRQPGWESGVEGREVRRELTGESRACLRPPDWKSGVEAREDLQELTGAIRAPAAEGRASRRPSDWASGVEAREDLRELTTAISAEETGVEARKDLQELTGAIRAPAAKGRAGQRPPDWETGVEAREVQRELTAAIRRLLRELAADRQQKPRGLAVDTQLATALLGALRASRDFASFASAWERARGVGKDAKFVAVALRGCADALRSAAGDPARWLAVAAEAWGCLPGAKGFRLYTRYMEVLGIAGAVAEAEELIVQAPHVPSLGNKLCPYLIEHYEAAYRNAGLSHERTVARMRSVITDA